MEIYTGTDIIEIDRIKDAIKSDTFIIYWKRNWILWK